MTTDTQTQIDNLDELKELCDSTEKQLVTDQNDDNLIEFLSSEYPKLTKASEKKIIELVKGKKVVSKMNATETKKLMNQLIGKSYMCDVNPIDNKGKFVGYTKLKHRIAQKKNNMKD